MKYITVTNKKNNQLLGSKIGYANTPHRRFIGLLGKKSLDQGEGLLLTPCGSIHMMFMKIPLDIIFLDRKNKVVYLMEDLKPWKFSPLIFKAQSALELPVGTIKRSEVVLDDILDIAF